MQGLRKMWNDGETTFGGWLTVANPLIAEATARSGVDYVCIDTQHGAINSSDAVTLIQAILLGGSRPLVRVAQNDAGSITKALDAGAVGVIVPMINNATDAEAAVSACRYPPRGTRSWGPSTAAMRIDQHYLDWSDEHVTMIPMIETAEAVNNLDAILAIDGINAAYVGPADLSISLGLPPGNNDDDPAFSAALSTIVAGCERAGVVAGIHSTGTLAPARRAMGFRMVTVTTEMLALKMGLAHELARARS